jgi:hypothetical protein
MPASTEVADDRAAALDDEAPGVGGDGVVAPAAERIEFDQPAFEIARRRLQVSEHHQPGGSVDRGGEGGKANHRAHGRKGSGAVLQRTAAVLPE